jgi:hypothetical protein
MENTTYEVADGVQAYDCRRERVHGNAGAATAERSQFSIVTCERGPGHWRAAITLFDIGCHNENRAAGRNRRVARIADAPISQKATIGPWNLQPPDRLVSRP